MSKSDNSEFFRETDDTWELIAEASKKEPLDIYTMLLNYYEEKPTQSKVYSNHPDISSIIYTDIFKKMFKKIGNIKELYGDITKNNTDSKKKNKKNKNKPKKSGKAEEMKKQNLCRIINTEVTNLSENPRRLLNFKSNVIEVILFQYIYGSYYWYKQKNEDNLINFLISLRDCIKFFRNFTEPGYINLAENMLTYLRKYVDWERFFLYYSKYLIKNNFRKNYPNALTPFPEQMDLINLVKETKIDSKEGNALILLPAGVGCGKTSLVSPLSTIYNRQDLTVIYCVPVGPVRDQTAANLYRCGIPFVYITKASNSDFTKHNVTYLMQPSYNCSDPLQPKVMVIDINFLKYFIIFKEKLAKFYNDPDEFDVVSEMRSDKLNGIQFKYDEDDYHPSVDILIPTFKKRYKHINHEIFEKDYALIMDEPSEDEVDINFVTENLPHRTIIMSATSCNIITPELQEKYKSTYSNPVHIIQPKTLGVSATIKSHWSDTQVLTPFHGSDSLNKLQNKINDIKTNIILKRFLSPIYLVDLYHSLKKMSIDVSWDEFDFMSITFDMVSNKIIEWIEKNIDKPNLLDIFRINEFRGIYPDLKDIISKNSWLFTKGCLVGTTSVKETYGYIQNFILDGAPLISDLRADIEHQDRLIKEYKFRLEKMSKQEKEDEKLNDVPTTSYLKIPEKYVINTKPYLTRFGNQAKTNLYPKVYTQLDLTKKIPEDLERLKLFGLASIIDNKEFYMKNIRDFDNKYISFLLVDSLGAYGLNLDAQHVILGTQEKLLSKNVMYQLSGRVGRPNQDSTGYVHIYSPDVFHTMFN